MTATRYGRQPKYPDNIRFLWDVHLMKTHGLSWGDLQAGLSLKDYMRFMMMETQGKMSQLPPPRGGLVRRTIL